MGDASQDFTFDDLVRFPDAAKAFPQVGKQHQWAYLLSRRRENGLDACVLDLGPRTKFLIRPRVEAWLKRRVEADLKRANG